MTMLVDGFIAGPADAIDWGFRYEGPNPAADEVIRSIDAVLSRRRSYSVGRRKGAAGRGSQGLRRSLDRTGSTAIVLY